MLDPQTEREEAVRRILDYTGQDAEGAVTVADVAAARERDEPLVQVTVGTADEAAAAEEAGIDMVVCLGDAVAAVREGSPKLFVTAAIDFGGAIIEDDLLGAAFDALVAGADAVITARGLRSVERLAHEEIPTMGHLGFVPKKSNLLGGVRAVGKTADEAVRLVDDFRRLEDAGAFAVECELIPARVMSLIRPRTGMTTISLGSGGDADVIFLFMNDLCGESPRKPRHARAYGDLAALHERVRRARVRALEAFRADARSGAFPSAAEEAAISDDERVWGYPLHKQTGVASGVMYPILHRFLDAGYLADGWQSHDELSGRPPRRYYTLTDVGRRELGAMVANAADSPKLRAVVAGWGSAQ